MLEYRICWSASSNISFHGSSDWEKWDGSEDATQNDIENELDKSYDGVEVKGLSTALETAIECSGFEWYVETREVETDAV